MLKGERKNKIEKEKPPEKTGKNYKNAKLCKAKRACLGERRAPGEKVTQPKVDTFTAPTTPIVVVLRVGDAWLVGVGKRAPHGFRCPSLVSPHGSLDVLNSLFALFPYRGNYKTDITGLGTVGQGRVGIAGSEMRGVLLVPSSSPTLSPVSLTKFRVNTHLCKLRCWYL